MEIRGVLSLVMGLDKDLDLSSFLLHHDWMDVVAVSHPFSLLPILSSQT